VKALWWAAAAWVCTAAAFAADEPLPRCDVAPGWTRFGPARSYGAETLYDYMDGNSEGYLIYGFQQMHGVTCKSGEASFVVDISEMPDAESAWGLFASNRDTRVPLEPSLGMAAQIVPQRGFFVKGNRFVEISASPTSIDHTAALRTFLRAMEKCLDGSTALPAAIGWFPTEGLDSASLRLVPQSVLGLGVLKRGYIAKYEYGRAFVVRQPSAESAAQVMGKLRQRFGETQAASIGDEGFQANDKYLGRLLFFRKGAHVAGFANLSDGYDPAKAAQALAARMQ
jgi:hypothetical protein